MNSVSAIIICFNPNTDKLNLLIAAIINSVDQVILFNNGRLQEGLLQTFGSKVRVESKGRNIGIAMALNTGCEIAVACGHRFIVSFDQDSLPETNMITILVQEHLRCNLKGVMVAAIGPLLADERDGKIVAIPFLKFTSYWYKKWSGQGTEPVAHIVTSGCLIELSVWLNKNKFEECFFIDLVDNAWCWQVISKGYVILGTTKTKMVHELSDGIKKTKFYSLNTYGSVRRYYQVRNATFLILYKELLPAQKLYLIRSLVVTFASVCFSDKEPVRSLYQYLRGIYHGISKKMGQIND